jgi:hypothetical protein
MVARHRRHSCDGICWFESDVNLLSLQVAGVGLDGTPGTK